jgi:hypothetical protein
MPAKDGTGPEGKGPRTGRGLGNCNTNNTQTKDSKFGRGFGPGRGLGFRNQNINND